MKQSWFSDDLVMPSFEAWLGLQLLAQTLPYSMSDFEKLNMPEFKFRRWPWVDPRNDAQTAEILLRNRLTTRTRLIHDSSSEDFEDTMDELDYECGYILEKENLLKLPDFGTDTSTQLIVNQADLIQPGETPSDTPGAILGEPLPAEPTPTEAPAASPPQPKQHHSHRQPRSAGGQFSAGN